MSKIVTVIYLITFFFWFFVARNPENTQAGLLMQIFLFIIPFIGAVVGLYNVRGWGGFKSSIGKSVGFISLGTLFWALGMLIWN
jgi:hypothetical protein